MWLVIECVLNLLKEKAGGFFVKTLPAFMWI